jgi:sugar phosphate isomerase/epimerase
MLTRRQFIERTVQGIVAGAAISASEVWAAGQLAWTKPIGLEIYTVRAEFAKDPAGTLKRVGAAGYREVEIVAGLLSPTTLKGYLRAANLTAPSTYIDAPNDIDSWKKTLDHVHPHGFRYIVVGDNPKLDADAWKRRADLFNECGRLAQQAAMQFCYHAHFKEFAPLRETSGSDTTGYDIMLERCDPKLLKMEMDVFWATYAGQDPLHYFQKYPGRFPMLHIKDLKPGFSTSTTDFPYDTGPNPFAPVGQGRIEWAKIFAHVRQAGVEHIFVEQDRCDGSPFDAIKTSFEYLRKLRLS